jgi:hypothetical protein
MVAKAISHPLKYGPSTAQTLITGSMMAARSNRGYLKYEGFDYNISYDFDAAIGVPLMAGIVGTYYMHQKSQRFPGEPVVDAYDDSGSGGRRRPTGRRCRRRCGRGTSLGPARLEQRTVEPHRLS